MHARVELKISDVIFFFLMSNSILFGMHIFLFNGFDRITGFNTKKHRKLTSV